MTTDQITITDALAKEAAAEGLLEDLCRRELLLYADFLQERFDGR